jgi:hypothetical protein
MPNSLMTPSKTMTIAASGTTSTAVEVEDIGVYGIDVPALTSSTFTIQGSVDGGATFRNIFDQFNNQVLTFPAGTGAFHIGAVACEYFMGCSHIQAVCGSAQASARAITLYMRRSPPS